MNQQAPHTGTQIDILWVLAHPDDESFGNAGTMLLANESGFTTGLICATRGEVGEIRDSTLATRESLAAVREMELRRAMRLAGMEEIRLLGFRDSGMAGTDLNTDPRALVQQPLAEMVALVAGHIRDLRPRSVISFGPDGIYGHPDHVRTGEITDAAVELAASNAEPGLGTPWQVHGYYHVAAPRERIIISAKNPQSPFHAMSEEDLSRFGTPADEITHWLDVSQFAAAKHAIVMQHLTQIARDNPFADINSPTAQSMLRRETYRRVPLPWEDERASIDRDPLDLLHEAHPGSHALLETGV